MQIRYSNARLAASGRSLLRWLLWLVVGLFLLAVLVPLYVRSRVTPSKHACFETLNAIDAAKEKYAAQHKLRPGDTVALTNLVGFSYLGMKILPTCPADGRYRALMKVGEPPACSIHNYQSWTNYNAEQSRHFGCRFR